MEYINQTHACTRCNGGGGLDYSLYWIFIDLPAVRPCVCVCVFVCVFVVTSVSLVQSSQDY